MTSLGNRKLNLWGGHPSHFVIILLSGKISVGKTTVATFMNDYLQSLGFISTKASFADEIKKCARQYFNWDGRKDQKGRRLLQLLGTEVGRGYNKDLWVSKLVDNLHSGILHPDFVVVDDWRFPNEAEYLENRIEYNVIKLRIESNKRGDSADHISETSLPAFDSAITLYDFVIFNNDTLEELRSTSEQLIDTLLNRR